MRIELNNSDFLDDDSPENIVYPRPDPHRPRTYEDIGEFIGQDSDVFLPELLEDEGMW